MRKDYKRIGDYVELVDERNKDLAINLLLGLTINKQFIPSVANTVGTNMKNYKIIRKNQFACSTMQVRRDKKMPIAILKEFDEAIISQAYPVFRVIDEQELNPDYLMMWYTRQEFDRQATFHAVGGVRGSIEWEDFLDFELPIPSIEKQRKIVVEYQAVENKIKTNEQICEKLEASAQALYRHWFVDFEFPTSPPPEDSPQTKGSHSPPLEGCPQDGVVSSTLEKCPQDGVVSRDTKAYKSLPYNPALKDRAKALRKAGNLAEVLFWKQVRNKQFMGLDFDRQKIIGNYIVDFYNANHQVVVEIDGSSHDNKQEYDAARDAYLESLGLTVIHITDRQVKKEIDSVMRYLTDHPALKVPLQWRGGRRSGWSHSGEDNHKNGHSLQKDEAHKAEASQSQEVKCMGDVGKEQTDHPAFQAPLQRRGTIGYKSSGGAMVYNEELEKEIPEGWEVNKLKSISQYSPDRVKVSNLSLDNYISTENMLQNKGGITISNGLPKTKTVAEFIKHDVLISNIRPYFKKIWSAEFQGGCSNDVLCFKSKIDSFFIYYTLERDDFFDYIMKGAKGTKMPRGDKKWIMNYLVVIPTFEVLEKYGDVIEKLDTYSKNLKSEEVILIHLLEVLLSKMANVEHI